jgi:MFS family permease
MGGERIQYTTHGALIVPDQPNIPSIEGAGVVIMLYTATATFGTYFWSRLSVRIGRDRMILSLVILGTLFQSLLSLSCGVIYCNTHDSNRANRGYHSIGGLNFC